MQEAIIQAQCASSTEERIKTGRIGKSNLDSMYARIQDWKVPVQQECNSMKKGAYVLQIPGPKNYRYCITIYTAWKN
jgi:hypothetical protein